MSKRFPGRRLSLFRLTLLSVVVASIVAGAAYAMLWWRDDVAAHSSTPGSVPTWT